MLKASNAAPTETPEMTAEDRQEAPEQVHRLQVMAYKTQENIKHVMFIMVLTGE